MYKDGFRTKTQSFLPKFMQICYMKTKTVIVNGFHKNWMNAFFAMDDINANKGLIQKKNKSVI